jgi:hypothetical protein
MLMEESRFRMRAVGSWIAPLLRIENKLRTKLYEGFLYFLDNGVGDVVDKAFALLDGLESGDDSLPDLRNGASNDSSKVRSTPVLPPERDGELRSNRLNSIGAQRTRATWARSEDREGIPRVAQKRAGSVGSAAQRSTPDSTSVRGDTNEALSGKSSEHIIEADVVEEKEDDGFEYADDVRPR